MKKPILLYLILIQGFYLFAQSLYFPPLTGDTWETIDPATLNWCPEKIDSLYAFLEAEETKSFLVLKDGKIVLEKYADDFGPDSMWIWYSAGKSLTSMLVGIAQEEGALDINDVSSDYLGAGWTSLTESQEEAITIWHQLTMTTGLDESEFFCTDPECLTFMADPGTRWVYHNAPYSLLRTVLENATGTNFNIYTNQRIKNKTGMNGFWLPVGFNNFYFSTARSMARFGLLTQNRGIWDGTVVLGDTTYMDQMIIPSQDLNPSYGYLWWLNGQESFIAPGSPVSFDGPIAPETPMDVYAAAGGQGQFISISPSEGLIMIRQGTSANNDLTGVPLLNNIWERIMNLGCTVSTIEETEHMPNVRLFPNPATDRIRLVDLPQGDFDIVVYDLLGNVVLRKNNESEIDTGHLTKGSYWLEVNSISFRKMLRFEKL